MKQFSKVVAFWTLLLLPNLCRSQHSVPEFMQKLRQLNNGYMMSYDYKVYLVKGGQGPVDSVSGRLSKYGSIYRDSSAQSFTAMNGAYFCKLDYDKKVATVYDVKLLQERLQLTMDERSGYLQIPDSILIRYGNLQVDTSSASVFRITMHFKGQTFTAVSVDVRRSDYMIRSVRFETRDQEAGHESDDYKKIYYLYNISNRADPAIRDLSGIFKTEGRKVVLDKKYQSYRLKSLNL